MELNKIFNEVEKCKRGCSEYYKMNDFIRRLNEIKDLTIEEDVVLTPFYLLHNSTYELYEQLHKKQIMGTMFLISYERWAIKSRKRSTAFSLVI